MCWFVSFEIEFHHRAWPRRCSDQPVPAPASASGVLRLNTLPHLAAWDKCGPVIDEAKSFKLSVL